MKRFLSYIEEIQKQRKLTKTQVYLATFGILLFLAIALILPNYLVKRQQIYKSRAQTTAALTPSGPVVINGQNGTVITGLKITSTTGDCVQIINSTNITIKESEIGPCNGRGISISGGSNNDVYDNYIHVENTPSGCCDTRDGILIENGSAFDTIQGNVIAYGESNIEVQTGSNHDISVIGNFLLNPRGPYPRGQNFQSWGTDGSHPNSNITVSNNYTSSSQDTTKYLYAENQEDSINFGHTTGITVQNNYVAGGHSDSGCGIIADADANSANFSNNILSDTGQCGIGIANGTNQVVNGNKILNLNPVVGAGNTALYVWSTYTAYPCGPVTVSDNIADEIKEDGVTHSGFWNGGGCGTVTLTNNTFNQAAYDILYPMASTNPPPLIPVQPKNCVANSPYTTNTSLAQCGSGSPSSSPSPSPSPSPTPTPSANLVGYWEFDEGTGTTAADSSGSSNAGTLINGAFWTAGKTGSAVSFDGVDDAVTIPASTKYDSNTFTTSFWINPLTLKSGNGNSNMIMGRETYITKGFRFGLNTNGAPSFWTMQSGGSISLTSSLVIPTNAFSHVVVTYDGSVGKMYINGMEKASASGTYVPPSGVSLTINGGIGGTQPSNSVIDDVRWYNQALSASEVQSLYAAAVPPPTSTPTSTATPTNTPTPTPLPATATINASPASASVTVGTPVTVNVVVDGGGQAFNAAQATVTVSPNLSITTLANPASNACNFTYTQTPTAANPSFAGGILATSSLNCTVYTLTLTPLAAGTGTITFTNASVKRYSDNGEMFQGVQNGSYTLVAPIPTPTPVPPTPTNTPSPTPTPTSTPVPPTPTPVPPTPTSTLPPPTVTSVASPSYQASVLLSGTKTTALTSISVNGSTTVTTYPTSTTWQATMTLNLGSNTVSVYGRDSLGNQTSTTTLSIIRYKLGDINGNTLIDLTDISLFATDWQKTSGFNYALSDMNNDSIVDLTDFSIIAKQYGQ